MDNPNINKLISSRDFAGGGGGYSPFPEPKKPDKDAPQAEWDAYHAAKKAYYDAMGRYYSPKEPKTLLESVKDSVKSGAKAVKSQFTDPESALQRTAAYGLNDNPEALNDLWNGQDYGDPITKILNTGSGVIKAGQKSAERVRQNLAYDYKDSQHSKNVNKVIEELRKSNVEIDPSSGKFKVPEVNPKTKALDNLKNDVQSLEDKTGKLERKAKRLVKKNATSELDQVQYELRKSKSELDKKNSKIDKLTEEYNKWSEKAVVNAQKDYEKAVALDEEQRNQAAFNKMKKGVGAVKDTSGAILDAVSSKHAAKTARERGAGGVKARDARIAYMLGDRSLGTKVMSGKLFKGSNFVTRFANKKINKAAIRHYNNKGFSEGTTADEIDARRDYESQVIAFILNKDYSKFEDFSEIARPTVVKQSKVGMEKLDTGEALVDAAELPYIKEGSGISNPMDILEKNYYMASPEEKRFQESLTMGFSEDDSNGNEYEKTLESLSKIVNPYE